ncbi:hypothetical protein PENSPDRAFT_683711 [Peniophora sp. CONT]|nr:hypothetical protein PENSPDRAFT_683711 [Peniophora sp. CONT]
MATRTTSPPALPDPDSIQPAETFRTLWAEALRKFQQSVKVHSTEWESLLDRLSSCSDSDGVLNIFDGTLKNWEQFKIHDPKWRDFRAKYLKPAIQALLLFSEAIAECAAFFPIVPGGKAIFVAFSVLLQATNGVRDRWDVLVGLFEKLNFFLESLSVRLAIPSGIGPATKTIAITILAHLLEIFSIATKLFSHGTWRARLEMQGALERLRTLTDLEVRAITAETQVKVTETHSTAVKMQIDVVELQSVVKQAMSDVAGMYQETLECLRAEQRHRTKVEASNILARLHRVEAADINAQNTNGCLSGTRIDVLGALRAWSLDQDAVQIYWLNGMAGIGKSAIARSFCHQLREDGIFGGSFFCSRRGAAEQAHAQCIIPTLAVSLALQDMRFNVALVEELEENPFSRYWNLEKQIDCLLYKPFAKMGSGGTFLPVLVVDALDECSDEDTTRELLKILIEGRECLHKDTECPHPDAVALLRRGENVKPGKRPWRLPLRFFLTSHPEPHIRNELEALHPSLGLVLRLHDVGKNIVEADMSLYLTHGLQRMRRRGTVPIADWPPKEEVDTLKRMSGGLFIYAFTALMYVRKNPVERLSKLTGTMGPVNRAVNRSLDDIYHLIISEAMNPDEYDDDEIELTGHMLAIIVFLCEPMTILALAKLLDVSTIRIRTSLDRLYAVIYVPTSDDQGFLRTFHASFGDYLTGDGRAPRCMHQHIGDAHMHLADACIRTMSEEQVLAHKDDALDYACLHWSHHVTRSPQSDQTFVKLEDMLMGPKLLFWLEVLSVLGCLHQTRDALEIILSGPWPADIDFSRFQYFLRDAVDSEREKENVCIFILALPVLALLHERGIGDGVVFIDYDYAAELLAQAAELGYAPSAYRLGECYEYGKMGCPQDPALSIHYYNIAAQQNHRDACFALTAWYLVGSPGVLPQSDTEAFLWRDVGIGTAPDPREANGYYKRAADLGDKRASQRLKGGAAPAPGGPGSVLQRTDNDGSSGGGGKDKKDKGCIIM